VQAYISAAGIANVLDMFDEAVKLVHGAGRIGGMEDAKRNAFAFAQASLGDLELAERSVKGIQQNGGMQEYVGRANRGLIAFRRGLIELGKEEYSAALRGFRAIHNQEMEASALVYFAYELAKANERPEAQVKLEEFDDLRKKIKLANVDSLGARIAAKVKAMDLK
jgi:hypothetical protein